MQSIEGFTVYFEKLDSILINAIHPKCFLCGAFMVVSDEKCVAFRGAQTMRLDMKCYDQFCVGISLFNQNMKEMLIHSDIN